MPRASNRPTTELRRPSRLVYLMRHAKSSWDDPDLADHDRPLTPRGLKAASRMAQRMVGDDIAPALVLCSSARRARETLAPIQLALGNAAKVEVEEGLYGASADELLRRLRRLPDSTASVMLIGHNPGMQELAIELVSDQRARSQLSLKFPTAALAALRLEVGRWRDLSEGGSELITFLTPRGA